MVFYRMIVRGTGIQGGAELHDLRWFAGALVLRSTRSHAGAGRGQYCWGLPIPARRDGGMYSGNMRFFWVLGLVAWLILGSATHAADSYARFYGSLEGLQAGEIAALAQDQTGFIWIGSQGGLLRFDGNRFVRIGEQQIARGVSGLWWDAHVGLLIQTEQDQAFLENKGKLQPLAGPDEKPIADLRSIAFDSRGQIWAIIGGELWRRDQEAQWTAIPAARIDGEQPQHLCSLEQGIALITDRGAWRFNADGHAKLLLHEAGLYAAAGGGAHPLWLADYADGSLWRKDGGHFVAVRRIHGRVLDMRYRGDTLWVSVDRYLLAIASDNSVSTIDVVHGLPSGGPLLVDHEGSLWVGTFVGLQQYPEPDTRHWSELDGLPWQHAYNVSASAGQVWISTWGGVVRFDTLQTPLRMLPGENLKGVLCADRTNRVWQVLHGRLSYWRDGKYIIASTLQNPRLGLGGCAEAQDGGVWLATNFGIFHAAPNTGPARQVIARADPADNYFTNLVWPARDGSLWTAVGDKLCHYQLTGFNAQLQNCLREPFELGASRIAEISPGRYWLSTRAGLFLFDGHTARLLPGNQTLPGQRFRTIEPAQSGGYWAMAPGALDRIVPCDNCAAGFHILESIGAWQGVPTDSALDVVELKSGDLWIAGNRGVFHVPAKARPGPQSFPPLLLADVSVDGREQAMNAPLHMHPGQKQLNLEFAALTFRDRSLLHYRFRNAGDSTWSAPTTNPDLQLVAPRPGDYHIFAQASLDGVHWTAPVSFGFSVLPPWYETWWTRLAGLLLILLLVAAGARLWLEYKLRLERQRVQIAMDLHDELGSTLGSIGMLAGALRHGNLAEEEQHRLTGDISDAVARLSGALRSVVWSMRQPRAGLRQLFTEIGDQAKHLFPESNPVVSVNGPAAADDAVLDPTVRRHVLMVALEAMHNVARHAHAREVTLNLRKLADGSWQLEVSDDGAGFDMRAPASGNGLESMHRRVRLIQAQLAIYSEPGGGTRITLGFRPRVGRSG